MISKNSKTIDYIGSSQIIYRGDRALSRLSEIWGVALKTPPALDRMGAGLAAVGALQAGAPPTLSQLALEGSPATLAKRVQEHAGAYATHMMIEAQQQQAKSEIERKITHEMESAATLDYLLKQLPLDEVEAQFIAAVEALGHSLYNLSAAVDKDAEAVANLRESGRKLASLQYLLTRNSEIYSSSLYADIEGDYETLFFSRDGFGRIEKHYDQTALDQHQSLASLRNTGLDLGNVFTAVALGKKPGVRFSLAKSHAELVERSQRMRNAGTTNQINHS